MDADLNRLAERGYDDLIAEAAQLELAGASYQWERSGGGQRRFMGEQSPRVRSAEVEGMRNKMGAIAARIRSSHSEPIESFAARRRNAPALLEIASEEASIFVVVAAWKSGVDHPNIPAAELANLKADVAQSWSYEGLFVEKVQA